MEEALIDALHEAGEKLAETMCAGLVARGLAGSLHVSAEGGRVVITSKSPDVVRAEVGEAGRAPTAPLREMARAAAPVIVAAFRARLGADVP